MIKKWVEAVRVRTLPVSIAGVLAGCGCAVWQGGFSPVPALLCLLFALSAQVASNFGNEYYDYKKGIDRKGRAGFRRGVAEGDISPRSMKRATFAMLALAAVVGCLLLFYGGWWLLPVGVAILVFALAYSAGPFPLSHHGLGDVAVLLFFGVVPVSLTFYVQAGGWGDACVLFALSVAVGLLAVNVLVVNNFRDMEDDAAVGKRTTVVMFGRGVMGAFYLLSGVVAMFLLLPLWLQLPLWALFVPLFYLFLHFFTWRRLVASRAEALNPLLGRTAVNLLFFAFSLFVVFLFA